MENQSLKPVTYLALGDSLTEGFGAMSPAHNFVSQFFEHLRRTERCQLRNWGVSGMTSGELLALVSNPGVTRLLPKLTHITITTGGCDFIGMYEEGDVTIRRLFDTVRTVQNHVKQILQVVRLNNPEAMVYLLGFYIPVPIYDLGVKKASMLVQAMNRYYEQLCRKYDVKCINPFESFFKRFDYFCDEVHPNQAGYDELAKLLIASTDQTLVPVSHVETVADR